ncbi:hypothetical protein AVEN_24397-1 [Araneus ventricosus]|uniref:Uncharacterized protein n=1 Tax=Araneus ventricosus TaxID=182803 RepID=A0A4Y2TU83_ARAVE|nr:hypothetical protein AVEN_38229-1 [Araneus ventricosus]GBO02615.1 hypothetical protein AVEN_59204-1 [Araneus ventricosus]GBO02990.1 hypothetical protein AVEN_102019-1 [Araneus ventricosus]GBO02996.1 hypothetical protein AVEN_24397-1 [Araneus ventricosus]
MHFPGYLCVHSRSGGGEFQTKTLRDDVIWERALSASAPFFGRSLLANWEVSSPFRGKFRCCFSRPHSTSKPRPPTHPLGLESTGMNGKENVDNPLVWCGSLEKGRQIKCLIRHLPKVQHD